MKNMERDMKKVILFATVLALAIVAKNVWTSGGTEFPHVEIDVQFRFSLDGNNDLRNES